MLKVEFPDKYPGTGQARRKTCPLFVGPGDNLDWVLSLYMLDVQGFDHFKSCQNTIDAIIFTPSRLAVQVAASQDWWQMIIET